MHPSIYFDPFETLGRWNQLFNGLTSNVGDQVQSGWIPAVDFEDRGEHYLVTADLPGIKPEDVEISLDGDVLQIKGERLAETDTGDGEAKRYRRTERVYGAFRRSFQLPADVDPDAIEAHGKDGVLHIRIGKHAATQPRRITVQTN